MTTIIAIERDGTVEIGADSQCGGDGERFHLQQSKVFTNNGVVYAVAGEMLFSNEVKHADLPSPPQEASDTDRWVTKELAPALRQLIESCTPKSQEDGFASHLLVVVHGKVYDIPGDLGWVRKASGAYAIGSGAQYATGALAAGADLATALRVAADNDPFTGYDLMATTADQLL